MLNLHVWRGQMLYTNARPIWRCYNASITLFAQMPSCCFAAGIALEHAYAHGQGCCVHGACGFDHWILTVLHTDKMSVNSSQLQLGLCTPVNLLSICALC